MNPRNIGVHALEHLPAFRAQVDTREANRVVDVLAATLADAQAFLVPTGLFNSKTDLARLVGLIKLPAPAIFLETDGGLALLAMSAALAGVDPQHGDTLIWPVSRDALSPVACTFHERDLAEVAETGRLRVTPLLLNPDAARFLDQADPQTFFNLYLSTLGELCALLACRNIHTEVIQAPDRLNRARLGRGKLPFSDYHALVVHLTENRRQGLYGPDGGHASPRAHLRRGHIRRLPQGPVWVSHCIVNPGREWAVKGYRLAA